MVSRSNSQRKRFRFGSFLSPEDCPLIHGSTFSLSSKLPLSLLKTATGSPLLVELKDGDTYNGRLVSCDAWMNMNLQDVICTSKDGDRFWKLPTCYIRGSAVKYLRLPPDLLEKAREEEAKNPAQGYGGNTLGGRGRGTGGRGRGGSVDGRGGRGGRGRAGGGRGGGGGRGAAGSGRGRGGGNGRGNRSGGRQAPSS